MNDMQTDRPLPSHDQAPFKTYGRHMRLAHRLGLEFRRRGSGFRERPELVRLDVAPDRKPSDKPPVRIYVGTEPAQHRAERVLLWSILAVRDPSRVYEIHLMNDLAGFHRRHWKTGFTGYRYAIPALASGHGRAIYNDVDQIYLADPSELFDLDMKGAGMLSITERETSVMLLDCGKMSGVWSVEEAKTMRLHKTFRAKTGAVSGLWGRLPGEWNARDFEFEPGRSKLLHFTILHTQPWQPFPKQLKYEPHALAGVWFDMERVADASGFTIFTRERPSQRFRQLAMESRVSRATPSGARTVPARQRAAIDRLAAETGSMTIALYDPVSGDFTEYPEGSMLESGKRSSPDHGAAAAARYDGIVALDTIGRLANDDVPWVLGEMFRAARRFVFAPIPRKHGLFGRADSHAPLGGISDPEWWRSGMECAVRQHPGVRWALG